MTVQKEALKQIVDVIRAMRDVTSTKAKQQLLKLNNEPDHVIELFKKVIDYTYNPRYSYNMTLDKSIIDTQEANKFVNFNNLFEFIDALNKGELTGNAAIQQYLYQKDNQTDDENFIMDRIIDRSFEAGVSITTINKVYPKLIPILGYMRCSLPNNLKPNDWDKWSDVKIVQEKLDGMFINIYLDEDNNISFFTRNGLPIELTERLKVEANSIRQALIECDAKNIYLHGEILIKYSQDVNSKYLPREESNGIINSIIQTGSDVEMEGYYPHIVLWDIISHDDMENGEGNVEYEERFDKLAFVVNNILRYTQNVSLVNFEYVHTLEEANKYAKKIINAGGEGAVLKNKKGLWKNGTSKNCVKLKLTFEVDLVVKGFTEGTGRNEQYFGAMTCQTQDGRLEVNVSVSGLKDSLKETVTKNMDSYIGKIVTVKANNVFDEDVEQGLKANLFLPVFVEFREDKDEANTLDEVKEIFNKEKGK